jgi:hypothetical protein
VQRIDSEAYETVDAIGRSAEVARTALLEYELSLQPNSEQI